MRLRISSGLRRSPAQTELPVTGPLGKGRRQSLRLSIADAPKDPGAGPGNTVPFGPRRASDVPPGRQPSNAAERRCRRCVGSLAAVPDSEQRIAARVPLAADDSNNVATGAPKVRAGDSRSYETARTLVRARWHRRKERA